MAINYKKELEGAAKTMILVHEPDTLIKMIVRRIVQKVKIRHAGILLRHNDKDTYILTVSRGVAGAKIPRGFARMDGDNPLIRFFKMHFDHKLFKEEVLTYKGAEAALRKISDIQIRALLKKALYQMEIFDVTVCIPSYFRNDLLGLLLLGAKNNSKSFAKDELAFFVALASDVAMAIKNAQLFRELALELERKKKLFFHTTIALAAAIDAKDHYTHGHTSRVTALSLEIARALNSQESVPFDQKFFDQLHIASLLHDIGKIGVPESILNKEGVLTEEEKKKMFEHPLLGAAILNPIKELEDAILGVKYHHERYDGKGYPEGLKGEEIPLVASIIAVADAFDAMTTNRPYRPALSKKEAIQEIERASGTQFSPPIAGALVLLYQKNKI